jgi:hypothetical protein
MQWTLMDARPLVALLVAAGVGAWGVSPNPLPADNVCLEIIALRNPPVFHALACAYATCWFTMPFLAASLPALGPRDRRLSPPAAGLRAPAPALPAAGGPTDAHARAW